MTAIARIALNSPACEANRPGRIAHVRPSAILAPDEGIYAPGDRADRLYSVAFGAVRIYRLLTDGRRQICAFCLPGDIFGFETDGVHRFFAEAIGTTGLCPMPCAGARENTSEIMNSALRCLVRAQEHLLVVGRQNAAERIAAFLLDLSERQGGLDQFELPMSRTDMGDYLGLTIETVSRVLSRLRAQGVIRLKNLRTVEIMDPACLHAMCA